MYNPYENNNKPYEERNNYNESLNQTANQNSNQTQTENQNTNQYASSQPNYNSPYYAYSNQKTNESYSPQNYRPQASYTAPPINYQTAGAAPKKKGSSGRFVLAIILAAVFSSAISISVMALMLQSSVTTQSISQDDNAFVINKVIDESASVEPTGEVSVLSKQEIADKVIPSVVTVQNYQQAQSFGGFMGGNTDTSLGLAGEGSGIIMSEDGYIVTNAHVVEDADNLKIILSDGTTYEATLVGADTVTDLAVVKIEATGLTPAEFGSSDDLEVGDEVIAVGNPGGSALSSTVTFGYVSALDRQITIDGYTMTVIQTDAAINPGNSGGALVNEYGHVVGINSSKLVSVDYEGLGFAIPTDDAESVISDLQNYGYVKDRAVLGISGTYIDEMTASYNGLSSGMYVAEITTQNGIDSGLEIYDVITEIDGVSITSFGTIASILAAKSPGETVELTVNRALTGESSLKISIVLSSAEEVKTIEESQEQAVPEQTTPQNPIG